MEPTTRAGREPGDAPLGEDGMDDAVATDASAVGVLVDDHGSAEFTDAEIDEVDDGVRVAIDDPDHSGHDLVKWVSWGIVAACCVFVFLTLNPQLILQNSTATGGDMGAHVWGPRFLADHLLPQFRISGWTQDWYAGFPAYVFYMVVPSLLVLWVSVGPPIWLSPFLLAGFVYGVVRLRRRFTEPWMRTAIWIATIFIGVLLVPVPYNIAFKLVTVSGMVTLPIAAYVLAKAARVAFPGPPLMALATLPFIYDKGFTILGGNGASTLAGEFAFSISLTLSLLYLAVIFRGVRTGRDRALGATLLALTILCHLIPAIFAGIATVLVLLFLRREDRTPWWDANSAGRWVAAALVALTLLTLVSDADLPVISTLRDLPGASVWFPSQWWFPALASVSALVLLTNFEPRYLQWTRRRSWSTVVIAAGVILVALGLVMARPTWWTITIAMIWLGTWCFAGIDARLGRWIILAAPVGGLLTAFWSIPFLGNSTYMNDMGWEKYTAYSDYLLAVPELDSGGMPYRNLVFALAGLGIVLSLIHRVRLGWFLALTVMALAWIFRFFPQYRLWNARLLPFYYLALYLLAGLALALVIRSIAVAVQDLGSRREEPVAVGVVGALVVTLLAGVAFLGGLKLLPGGEIVADPAKPTSSVYRWPGGGFPVAANFQIALVNDWSAWNYAGLEGKDAYPEFSGVMDMMDRVSAENGCGRAFWEYETDLNRHGTTMALMLLPYYTDGCVGSMEGLYFEASSTTPFHFLMQSELSAAPSRAQRELPYESFNIDKGVSHLQMLGVKYYMATTAQAIEAARTDARLTPVAEETFTYADAAGTLTSHTWAVFEVADSELVVGLANDPVVATDADDHIDGWVYAKDRLAPTEAQVLANVQGSKTAGPATSWFMDPAQWDVHLATSGPDGWPRATAAEAQSNLRSNPPVEVSEIETTTDSISFDVDRVGVPVLVKVSYFPNWSVTGAEGPYRVTPNFMVVVPTESRVELNYGSSKYDVLGWALTLLGLCGLAGLAVLDHRRRLRSDADADTADTADAADAAAAADTADADTAEAADAADTPAGPAGADRGTTPVA